LFDPPYKSTPLVENQKPSCYCLAPRKASTIERSPLEASRVREAEDGIPFQLEVALLKSIRRFVWCVALFAVLGIIMPAAAMGAGRGSRPSGARAVRSGPVARARQGPVHVDVRRPSVVAARRGGQGGPLSYNAYWRAATSPNPPRPNQNNNRYAQKLQAWQEYQQRQK
jgi:hypothetical protein